MNFVRNLLGSLIYGIAKAHAYILDGLVYILETGVLLARSFIKGCVVLLGMGGCLAVFLLVGPVGTWLLRHPAALAAVLFILIFPVLGAASVSFLKYFKAVSTNYLFNLARFLKDHGNVQYRSYRFYKEAYRQAEEAAARREQARREQQQREWEQRFWQWQQYSGQWQQGERPTANPYVDFKSKYEKSCAILDVPVTADQYKIKLAYRRKAKTYHPDVNKDPNATRQFQAISEAYEFLNEDNIRRYQSMRQ
jgi:hypothetical protein